MFTPGDHFTGDALIHVPLNETLNLSLKEKLIFGRPQKCAWKKAFNEGATKITFKPAAMSARYMSFSRTEKQHSYWKDLFPCTVPYYLGSKSFNVPNLYNYDFKQNKGRVPSEQHSGKFAKWMNGTDGNFLEKKNSKKINPSSWKMIFWKRAIQGKTPQIAFVKSNETKYVFREEFFGKWAIFPR